jgi:hypothetical protein
MSQDIRSGGDGGPAHQDLPGSLWGQLGHDYLEPTETQTAVKRKLQESGACHQFGPFLMLVSTHSPVSSD